MEKKRTWKVSIGVCCLLLMLWLTWRKIIRIRKERQTGKRSEEGKDFQRRRKRLQRMEMCVLSLVCFPTVGRHMEREKSKQNWHRIMSILIYLYMLSLSGSYTTRRSVMRRCWTCIIIQYNDDGISWERTNQQRGIRCGTSKSVLVYISIVYVYIFIFLYSYAKLVLYILNVWPTFQNDQAFALEFERIVAGLLLLVEEDLQQQPRCDLHSWFYPEKRQKIPLQSNICPSTRRTSHSAIDLRNGHPCTTDRLMGSASLYTTR